MVWAKDIRQAKIAVNDRKSLCIIVLVFAMISDAQVRQTVKMIVSEKVNGQD